MHIVEENDLPTLLEGLRRHFPKSLQLYCQVRNRIRGVASWEGTEFIVDKFPDFEVCLNRPDPQSKKYVPRPKVGVQTITLYSSNHSALSRTLQEGAVDWKHPACFLSIPTETLEAIAAIGQHYGTISGVGKEHYTYCFTPQTVQNWKRQHPVLPAGYSFGQLKKGEIPQIAREWNFAGRGGNPEDAYPYFTHMLENGSPNVGLFDDKDELIAYEFYSPNGSMSHAYVREDHRGKGLIGYVMNELAERIFVGLGQEITWSHIKIGNEPSLNAHVKAGAEIIEEWRTQVVEFYPSS